MSGNVYTRTLRTLSCFFILRFLLQEFPLLFPVVQVLQALVVPFSSGFRFQAF